MQILRTSRTSHRLCLDRAPLALSPLFTCTEPPLAASSRDANGQRAARAQTSAERSTCLSPRGAGLLAIRWRIWPRSGRTPGPDRPLKRGRLAGSTEDADQRRLPMPKTASGMSAPVVHAAQPLIYLVPSLGARSKDGGRTKPSPRGGLAREARRRPVQTRYRVRHAPCCRRGSATRARARPRRPWHPRLRRRR